MVVRMLGKQIEELGKVLLPSTGRLEGASIFVVGKVSLEISQLVRGLW